MLGVFSDNPPFSMADLSWWNIATFAIGRFDSWLTFFSVCDNGRLTNFSIQIIIFFVKCREQSSVWDWKFPVERSMTKGLRFHRRMLHYDILNPSPFASVCFMTKGGVLKRTKKEEKKKSCQLSMFLECNLGQKTNRRKKIILKLNNSSVNMTQQ